MSMGIGVARTAKDQRIPRLTFGMLCFLAGALTTVLIGMAVFMLGTEN